MDREEGRRLLAIAGQTVRRPFTVASIETILDRWEASQLQGGLFDQPDPIAPPATPKARATDPQTSHAAAADAKPRAVATKKALLALLYTWTERGLTADEIHQRLPAAHLPTISTRLSEMVREGLVEDTGRTRITRRGSAATVYRITDKGRDARKG